MAPPRYQTTKHRDTGKQSRSAKSSTDSRLTSGQRKGPKPSLGSQLTSFPFLPNHYTCYLRPGGKTTTRTTTTLKQIHISVLSTQTYINLFNMYNNLVWGMVSALFHRWEPGLQNPRMKMSGHGWWSWRGRGPGARLGSTLATTAGLWPLLTWQTMSRTKGPKECTSSELAEDKRISCGVLIPTLHRCFCLWSSAGVERIRSDTLRWRQRVSDVLQGREFPHSGPTNKCARGRDHMFSGDIQLEIPTARCTQGTVKTSLILNSPKELSWTVAESSPLRNQDGRFPTRKPR